MPHSFSETLILFAGVYLSGLALNLTPCIYPMLSVTVSLFSREGEKGTGGAFLRALVYVLGLSTMFSVLGFGAAIGGAIFGQILQNPLVLTVIGLVILVLAGGMLGLYTFSFPAWIMKIVPRKAGAGFIGIYLSGLFVGVFAAPCIGPPVIAVMTVVATRGDALLAFAIFFIMALGLGTPYLVLGTFSGLLRRLPKSGSWLLWIERLLGVILAVVGVFYLLAAWAAYLLPLLGSAALIAGGAYLGFFVRAEKESKLFTRTKNILGVCAVAVGIAGFFQSPSEAVRWEAYAPQKIVAAQAARHPVAIDFYANWCIPCHELERFTYSNPEVIKALEPFVRLKVDLTQPEDPAILAVARKYQVMGVPSVVFLDIDGREIEDARISGFVSPEEMLIVLRSIPRQKTQAG
jgi:thiol:disulfide interchange protein DsbD